MTFLSRELTSEERAEYITSEIEDIARMMAVTDSPCFRAAFRLMVDNDLTAHNPSVRMLLNAAYRENGIATDTEGIYYAGVTEPLEGTVDGQ